MSPTPRTRSPGCRGRRSPGSRCPATPRCSRRQQDRRRLVRRHPAHFGATAFVVGDVVGHGVTAATIMGRIRTAIRSYALLELSPSEVLRNVSQLTAGLAEASFVTCFYAVHDPGQRVLTYANAGHLPAILVKPRGETEQIGEASRTRDLTVGIEWLLEGIPRVSDAADLETAGDQLISELTLGRHDDDIALIHVRRHVGSPAAE